MIGEIDLVRTRTLNFDLLTVGDKLCQSLSLGLGTSRYGCNQECDGAGVGRISVAAGTELGSSKQSVDDIKSALNRQLFAHLLGVLADLER